MDKREPACYSQESMHWHLNIYAILYSLLLSGYSERQVFARGITTSLRRLPVNPRLNNVRKYANHAPYDALRLLLDNGG